jgi:GntR family transcriptional repressor for pyruvate dehydrogenase complex
MEPEQNLSNANELFKAIERAATLTTHVTDQIEQLIYEGHLQPGDRLPPERELARQFGVSRTVIREAMHALVAKSLLEVRAGSGTVVRSPSAGSVAQSMVMFLRAGQPEMEVEKVQEIRSVLEVANAGLAAQRRTAGDVAEMERILAEECQVTDRDGFAECDVAFHAALAQATHNELFSLLLDSVGEIMLEWREFTYDVPDTPARAVAYHRAILEQVKAGDPEGARQAMRAHLAESEDTMRKALALHAGRAEDATPASLAED